MPATTGAPDLLPEEQREARQTQKSFVKAATEGVPLLCSNDTY